MFLHRLISVLVEYFKELEEESIRDNFVVIYELLDEMMDFGYPQTTETKILQECVSPPMSYWRLNTYNLCRLQIHYTRISQARDPSQATDRRYECRLVEKRGHPLP